MKYGELIALRVSSESLAKLEAEAAARDVNVSIVVRDALAEHFNNTSALQKRLIALLQRNELGGAT